METVIRVFPRKTSMTPDDAMTFFGDPPLDIPLHSRVDICCVFTWDKEKAEILLERWQDRTDKPVRLGGPAYNSAMEISVSGLYIKKGVVFTSRGCPNKCGFCFVPQREGELREIAFDDGNIIQDNNFLACSREHKEKVYQMLKDQKDISFRGGLEPKRLSDWDIEKMKSLRIKDLWLACDTRDKVNDLESACKKLHEAGFSQAKIRCYVLIGDDFQENLNRLKKVYAAGALPFAQLFQPDTWKEYSKEWKKFARTWSRPAAYKAEMAGKKILRDVDTGILFRQELVADTVMCKNCLREVAVGSECEICGASLTDERGRYEMPCVELGLCEGS